MEKKEILNLFLRTDPFEMLDEDALHDLAERVVCKTYPTGSYVFRQGDASLDCLIVVASGLVEITVAGDRGQETVIGLRRKNDFFSETVVLSQLRYPASARVKEEVVCVQIQRRDLERLIYNNPEFSGFFNALLAERMRLLYEDIVQEQSSEAYGRIESPLFRKKVSEIMAYPVITCSMDEQVRVAAEIMDSRGISALVVCDRTGRPRGILTESLLVKHLIASDSCNVRDCTVKNVMGSSPARIAPEAFTGQALVSMIRNKNKHILVMEREELVGIVSMIDLLKSRSTGTLLLTHDIESQPQMEGLKFISQEIDSILSALIAEKATVKEIFEVMSELHERLTRRVIVLAEERMKREGHGPLPVSYCWINMGSAARYEQTLRTDQDNAIIYEDPQPGTESEVDLYFQRLSGFVVDGLVECGFDKCSGGVMATERKWRRSYSEWSGAISEWTRSYDPEDTRILTILLDFRPVWGDFALAEKFREDIFDAFQESLAARHMLVKDDLQYKLPINFLGTFITEKSGRHKNEMDLKRSASAHMVNGIRLFAVNSRISEASTFGRLERLVEKGDISKDDADFFQAGFETLMMFRIRENMKKVKRNDPPDNYIDPYSLRKREKMILKDALSGVSRMQKLVNGKFNVVWLRNLV